MEPIYLKNVVKNEPSGAPSDLNAPYSFLEWKQRRPSFAEKDVVFHYNRYVLEWFDRNKEKPISQKFLIRQKYLYLLDQLQLFFSEDEKNLWYSKINLADEKELLLGIPYFAKKLKDIALYYLKLRKKLKNTKIQYNTVGTSQGLEQEIYRLILENFSSANKELSPYTQTIVPQFSSLQQTLAIDIQEIYDDKNYFDISTTKPVSASFNLFHGPTERYFQTKGIVLSSDEWLFNCLSLEPSANFESFFAKLTGNIFETPDDNLYGSYIQTFLSENKFTLTFDSLSSVVEVTDVPLSQGNNYFYYPYGTVDASLALNQTLKPIALSSLNIDGATAGTSLEDSDTIFVKNGDKIESAWLYFKEYEPSQKTVKATLPQNQTTSFIFPFPGYGLSAEGVEWTGSSLETTQGYNFLSREFKNLVNQAYWSQILSADSTDPLMLNNATAVLQEAANKNPNFADKIYIRQQRSEDTNIPRTELSGAAWLFRFEKSALPVTTNSQNKILWPYGAIELEENEEYPTHLEKISFQGACQNVSIQDLNKSYFVAASSFELADKVYKLASIQDSDVEAVECCWLSGAYVELNNYGMFEQNGFSALFPAGEATRFIWTGPSTTLQEAFRSVSHASDCPFSVNSLSASDWEKCSCKQVYYSPFGHPGRQFQDNNGFADCVIQDLQNNLDPFDFGSWRDSLNRTVNNSTQFAWYKTKSQNSWGDGQWISSNLLSATPFVLQRGRMYFYYRANSRTREQEFPPYSINLKFPENKTVWIEAKKNQDGTWASTNKQSQIVLNAGDFVRIDRRPSTTSFLVSSTQVENISENKTGSIWSTFDTIAVGSASNSTTISWPVDNSIPIDETSISQYPPASASIFNITNYNAWKITRIEDGDSQIIYNTPVVTFVPPTTGTYSIAVTATVGGFTPPNGFTLALSGLSAAGVKVYASSEGQGTFIPRITAISQYGTEKVQFEFKTPSSGFLIEHSLKGWSYPNNGPSSAADGARPYWAQLFTDKSLNTKNKGTYSWGYPQTYIDGYLPNHAPLISPLEINYGTIVEYERKNGYTVTWNQPITYKTFVGTPMWCQLSSSTTNFSNLSAIYSSKEQHELTVNYNTSPSQITLTNLKNGMPVEIYYYALNSFVWPVSVATEQELQPPSPATFFESPKPWANLGNRFYSTIATLPTLEETYTLEDVGGYFIPQNLGASQFINKDFTASLKTLNLSGTFLTEDTNIHVGGRGRTGQDQETLYNWSENNQWLKEPPVAGQLAGAVKKSLTKTLQTFVPYQTNLEEVTLGPVTPRSRVSPWGGPLETQWTDTANQPQSFTGVPNVSAWVQSQVLKQNKKEIDCWTSDIYGNQYALYKEFDNNTKVSQRLSQPGELWLRTNNQVVCPAPANQGLSAVYSVFPGNSLIGIQGELVQNNTIKQVECFFDTLMVELTDKVLFIKLDYDYEEALLSTSYDNVIGAKNEFGQLGSDKKFDRTWFFPQTKKVVSLITNLSGAKIIPELWELDIDNFELFKVFDGQDYVESLSGVSVAGVERGCLHFNNTLQQYLITYEGTDSNGDLFVLDFVVSKQQDTHELKEINWYLSTFQSNEPPVVSDANLQQVFTLMSPSVVQLPILNNPTAINVLNYQNSSVAAQLSTISFNNVIGLFNVVNLPIGLHHINYEVSNSVGSSIYSLTVSII